MDGKSLACIGAVAFVAVAITAAVIEMNRSPDRQDDSAPLARSVTDRDPLRAELARCGSIGEAGARDPSCLRTWAENRRRFLGQPRRTTSQRRTRRRPCSRVRPLNRPRRSRPRQTGTGAADMQGAGVIDNFLDVFTRYIDSGFGLLRRRSLPASGPTFLARSRRR